MNKYNIDIPVALIFFNRPEPLYQVFSLIKKARPSKLFLIQDGARINNSSDIVNIQKCQDIVKNIDWECDIYKDYSNINLGCGKRIFTGLTNAFKKVDRLVIIEDDILFSDSFLPFCSELLEMYKNDQRIQMISGMNHLGIYEDCPYSYFFSLGGAIWGWATWKRAWDELEWNLHPATDKYINKVLANSGLPNKEGVKLVKKSKYWYKMISEGNSPSFWSFHFGYYAHLQSRLNIVPKVNLIQNIGITPDSTHSVSEIKKMPKIKQGLFFAKIYDIKFPLYHPMYVLDDRIYKYKQDQIMSPRGLKKIIYLIEYTIRNFL